MKPRALRVAGRGLLIVGAAFAALGLLMPYIAMGLIHDSAPQAQVEVDRAKLNLLVTTVNLGTKVSTYGTVEGLVNATDLDFIPDDFPIKVAAMKLHGLDGLVLFENKLGFVNGETAVVEGYYVSFTFNNTTYAMVSGSSLPSMGFAIATGFLEGVLRFAHVFRPWWDATGFAFLALGVAVEGGGWSLELLARRRAPSTPPRPATPP